ncbi:MAG: DNA polymerase domain-containing protein [Candidatus Eremiobacterota bacterium]
MSRLEIEVEGRTVSVSSPDKVYFPRLGKTKLDLVHYYLSVGSGALRGVRDRPMVLKRFVEGAEGEAFYQKRAPSHPDWMRTCTITFPSGRSADEIVLDHVAGLAWTANLGCLDLNPWPVRSDDVDHPDELRIDLDPGPGVEFRAVREVALVAREVLHEHGLEGWPKTSGSRGIHILVRVEREWDFSAMRRAALALAREVERRVPALATSRWWKEERHGVFVDYNQNARDRTVASAYSVRPTPDARVSCPLHWDEVPGADPAAFTMDSVPARFAAMGDPHAGIDERPGRLDGLLELSARQEAQGLGEAPYPPHFPKARSEPRRVQPSRRRKEKPADLEV